MLQRIKKVSYLNEYKLKLVFVDNKCKIVDFEEWIKNGKGYFLALRDVEYFKKVSIDDCQYTICWPNGLDFCPDVLYEIGKEVKNAKEPLTKRKTDVLARRKKSTAIKAK